MATRQKKAAAEGGDVLVIRQTKADAEAAINFDELSEQNIQALTAVMQTSAETMDMLVSKLTSLACHVTALEALLCEVIRISGVDLVKVNSLIRSRIQAVDGGPADSNVVIDIAASIASPAPRRTL